jgi:hypothetical protein
MLKHLAVDTLLTEEQLEDLALEEGAQVRRFKDVDMTERVEFISSKNNWVLHFIQLGETYKVTSSKIITAFK